MGFRLKLDGVLLSRMVRVVFSLMWWWFSDRVLVLLVVILVCMWVMFRFVMLLVWVCFLVSDSVLL